MPYPISSDSLQDLIFSAYPELEGIPFTLINEGWDSVAVDVGGEYIFKFPRNASAALSLRKEVSLLSVVRPILSLAVPDPTLHAEPHLFSRHAKIPGAHLLEEDYEKLPGGKRQVIASDIATFYHELHRIDHREISAAGATHVQEWPEADEILKDLKPLLSSRLYEVAADALERWLNLAPDPLGITYGFFDGHGWNMAFDHALGRLNGVYDFADSGFGALHREFIYTDFISRDLTQRVVGEYEQLAGVSLDHERIDLLSGVLRLSDLAGTPDHPVHGEGIRRRAEDWLNRSVDLLRG